MEPELKISGGNSGPRALAQAAIHPKSIGESAQAYCKQNPKEAAELVYDQLIDRLGANYQHCEAVGSRLLQTLSGTERKVFQQTIAAKGMDYECGAFLGTSLWPISVALDEMSSEKMQLLWERALSAIAMKQETDYPIVLSSMKSMIWEPFSPLSIKEAPKDTGKGSIGQLNNECLFYLSTFLGPRDLVALAKTSRRWHKLICTSARLSKWIWNAQCRRDHGDECEQNTVYTYKDYAMLSIRKRRLRLFLDTRKWFFKMEGFNPRLGLDDQLMHYILSPPAVIRTGALNMWEQLLLDTVPPRLTLFVINHLDKSRDYLAREEATALDEFIEKLLKLAHSPQ